MAGKESGRRRSASSRTTLVAAGHVATAASAGSARTVSGESKASDRGPSARDSIPRADGLRRACGSVDLPLGPETMQGLNCGPIGDWLWNAYQRGIPLCRRPTAALGKAAFTRAYYFFSNNFGADTSPRLGVPFWLSFCRVSRSVPNRGTHAVPNDTFFQLECRTLPVSSLRPAA